MSTVTNAHRILSTLDALLDSSVDLTLYGRAALHLGLPNAPAEVAYSRDVDAVLWLGQAETLAETTNFWEALEKTNEALASDGLYISHLFEESQVILRPEWRRERARVAGTWVHLEIFRLADPDLLLSKLMRDDPQDLRDALTIASAAPMTLAEIETAMERAVVPSLAEIEEQFEICRRKFWTAWNQRPSLN
ncbi:MAG: hypothetical protein V4726_02315 [Verrucomicrobiota bacterium]